MKCQDIIDMAREAVTESGLAFDPECDAPEWLAQFAALVIARDRERLSSDVELPEPEAFRITDGEGGYNYRDELPQQWSLNWSARYGRKYEPLFTADQLRDYGDRRAAAERLACAELAESSHPDDWAFIGPSIRARGQQ